MEDAVLSMKSNSGPKVRDKEEVDAETSVSLCERCLHRKVCGRYAREPQPIVSCDSFIDGTGFSGPKTVGLCSNCERREYCMLPRSETGVWHCEEYK